MDTSALIIAQDCSSNALTLRGYAILLALESPYVCEGREPTIVDAVMVKHVLERDPTILDPDFAIRIAKETDALSTSAAAALVVEISDALSPLGLAIAGLSNTKNKVLKPSNGIVPAILLSCAKTFGWTTPASLDTPIATLFVVLRESAVQAGEAISFHQMELIDYLVANKTQAEGTKNG